MIEGRTTHQANMIGILNDTNVWLACDPLLFVILDSVLSEQLALSCPTLQPVEKPLRISDTLTIAIIEAAPPAVVRIGNRLWSRQLRAGRENENVWVVRPEHCDFGRRRRRLLALQIAQAVVMSMPSMYLPVQEAKDPL